MALAASAGCRGEEAGPGAAGDAQVPPPVFTCDEAAEPPDLPLPRLSRAQLENTLRFAVRLALPEEEAAVWSAVAPTFSRYPADLVTPAPGDLRGGYSRMDQSIQQARVDAMYDVGTAIARELTATPERLAAMMGACATDAAVGNDRACLEGFVATWGARVQRAPLSADDVTFYADAAGDTPVAAAGVADVVTVLLNAPQTLYRVEHGTDAAAAVSPLSAFELAARLSLHFWQAPPDDQLWAAAEDGSLLTDEGYRAALARLVDDPLTRRSMDEMVRQWLRLDELPPLDTLAEDPVFVAFAGEVPPPTAHGAMIDDVLDSMGQILEEDGTLSDFLRDGRSYARDPYVADIYGTAPWDGVSDAPLTPEVRSGLLTRPALLATGTPGTRPIHKGYLVRNALLCQQLGAPPPDADITPPTASEASTTRDAVTQRTGSGVCVGCHHLINPPGFLTEGFDALGRARTEEALFDDEGNLVGSLPVNTAAVPEVSLGDLREMDTPLELTDAIDDSRLFHACFARHTFRFAQARVEQPADGCLLSDLEAAAWDGAPVTDVLEVIANDPGFKARRFE